MRLSRAARCAWPAFIALMLAYLILPLALVVDRLSSGAAVLDLPQPEIAVGRGANFCLVDLSSEWEVGEHGYESRSENCCFAGRRLRGRVVATVAAGGLAYRERTLAVVA